MKTLSVSRQEGQGCDSAGSLVFPFSSRACESQRQHSGESLDLREEAAGEGLGAHCDRRSALPICQARTEPVPVIVLTL